MTAAAALMGLRIPAGSQCVLSVPCAAIVGHEESPRSTLDPGEIGCMIGRPLPECARRRSRNVFDRGCDERWPINGGGVGAQQHVGNPCRHRLEHLTPRSRMRHLVEHQRPAKRLPDACHLFPLRQRLRSGQHVVHTVVLRIAQRADRDRPDVVLMDGRRGCRTMKPAHRVAASDLRRPPVATVERERTRPKERPSHS